MLVRLCTDPEWEVRCAGAQAATGWPFGSKLDVLDSMWLMSRLFLHETDFRVQEPFFQRLSYYCVAGSGRQQPLMTAEAARDVIAATVSIRQPSTQHALACFIVARNSDIDSVDAISLIRLLIRCAAQHPHATERDFLTMAAIDLLAEVDPADMDEVADLFRAMPTDAGGYVHDDWQLVQHVIAPETLVDADLILTKLSRSHGPMVTIRILQRHDPATLGRIVSTRIAEFQSIESRFPHLLGELLSILPADVVRQYQQEIASCLKLQAREPRYGAAIALATHGLGDSAAQDALWEAIADRNKSGAYHVKAAESVVASAQAHVIHADFLQSLYVEDEEETCNARDVMPLLFDAIAAGAATEGDVESVVIDVLRRPDVTPYYRMSLSAAGAAVRVWDATKSAELRREVEDLLRETGSDDVRRLIELNFQDE